MNNDVHRERSVLPLDGSDVFPNVTKVEKGFHILRPYFAGYIAQEMNRQYKGNWWREILSALDDPYGNLPDDGEYGYLVDALDIASCLRVLDRRWNEVFRTKLSIDYRTWAKELMGVRNRVAHIAGNDFSENDTWRALDTIARLCQAFDNEAAEEVRTLLREARYGSAAGSTAQTTNVPTQASPQSEEPSAPSISSPQGLPSWREIMEPHPDVAKGVYRNAEFAADLYDVARGTADMEYRDPVEFFGRTYVTEGMRNLLVESLRRVAGQGGDPVIQLKTAFGGGKTHSMLALYHMMKGQVPAHRLPALGPILEEAGVTETPKVNVAVLVGTKEDATKTRRPPNLPGISVSTLWGEIAAQLVLSTGRPELYEYVRSADRKGVSPGAEALRQLFDDSGPNLILIDELVAYARKLYGRDDLPAGTFENLLTFVQELTEAARSSRNTLVVASIPESDIEIGGDAGAKALDAIEHTFGRMETVWKPVAANEGFEVVRRRLFLDCKDPAKRDAVCAAFSRMYASNPSDFPVEAREAQYKDRMVASYPIHPELFDRLYEDWATLDRFQRTRGVLRLMAAVIHELWMGNDMSPMIMPGSISLDVPNVRDELTRYLDEGWNAIVDREVDGKNSIPYQKDKNVTRYGRERAARRVARTVMLGSAPTDRKQAVRGIESSRIRLGTVQPGENVAGFNDALATLQNSLAYLYSNPSGDRFWFDTRPTLRKTAEDRANGIAATDVEFEIERRLKALRKQKSAFRSVHTCPASPGDVEDKPEASLVILRPDAPYRFGPGENAALGTAENILNHHRAQTPRINRNMLAFVAADAGSMGSLREAVRRCLAWASIVEDKEALNLDTSQVREAQTSLQRSDDAVNLLIQEAYSCLLVPRIDREEDIGKMMWDVMSIRGGDRNLVSKAADKMIESEALITNLAPRLLVMDLERLQWASDDSVQIKNLWENMCRYCYLPRLADYSVLEEAIQEGATKGLFGIAAGKEDGEFLDLIFGQNAGRVDKSALLVRPDAARRQIEEESVQPTPPPGPDWPPVMPAPVNPPPVISLPEPPKSKNTRFYLSTEMDRTRINRDVHQLVTEVLDHLWNTEGARVTVSLEVEVEAPEGIPQDTVRTVAENCRTLKVKDYGFDE